MTALCVGMATPRKWTADEITLVEVVAAQTRAAVETARHILHERALLRDVLASVTEGKLILTESQEQLPKKLMPYGDPVILDKSGGLDLLREKIRNACQTGNHSELRAFDLLTAASEAGMNAIVHAERGTANLSIDENGTIQVAIEDNGTGIAFDDLPKATLARGYSTKSTLGHGLKMILETIDRLYLLTGPGGTTVVMEQDKFEPQPFWLLQQKEK
jgi:anti-sigma regulatory factor (Ser/Thr protein kinase)